MNWQALVLSGVGILLPTALLQIFPFWQKRFFFTVRVPDGYVVTAGARETLHRFRLAAWGVGILCGAAMYFGVVTGEPALTVAAPLVNTAFLAGLIQWARLRTLPEATAPAGAIRRASLVENEDGSPWWIWGAPVMSLVILAAAVGFLTLHWDDIPVRFPIHWDIDGQANGWSRKSFFGVYRIHMTSFAVQTFIAFCIFALSQTASPRSLPRRRANQAILAVSSLGVSLLLAVISLFPLRGTPAALPGPWWAWMVLPLAFAAPAVAKSLQLQKLELEEVEPTRDENWWGGMLYADSSDSRMMVPNRMGPGYSLNIGNPAARIVAALLVLFTLGTVFSIPLAGQDAKRLQARDAATEFARGDYAAIYRRGAPVLQNSVTPAAFEQQLARVAASLGVCKAPMAETVVKGTSYLFGLECSQTSIGVNIVLDGSGLIQGFFLAPPPASASSKPVPLPNLEVVTGEFKLPARLTVPATGDAPFACVVLVHGSGPQDMDETVIGNKPFRDLADGLAARNVATLRYDKRTKVYGAKSEVKTLADETIDDAVSAARLCAKQPKVDAHRVFILGHSLGGYAAPRIAQAAGSNVRGMIVLAGTSRPLAAVIDEQIAYLGAPPEQAAAIKKTIPESWWKDVEGYNPAKLAASLDTPFLILQGERDYQVTMADFAGWREALGGSKRATLRSYPKLNHLFIAGEGKPGPTEYFTPGHVAVEAIDDIAAWVKSIRSPIRK